MGWKLATFNVNGVRARLPVLLDWLAQRRPDVVCLQEIKCEDRDFPVQALQEVGYTLAVRGQKSFNGVAILSLNPPAEVLKQFGDGGWEEEARFIAARVNDVWVVNTYVPQGRDPEDPAFEAKLRFLRRLGDWFEEHFHPEQSLVWTGDINVAPEPIDVYDPERLEGTVGYHPLERQMLRQVIRWGFVDLYRSLNPGAKQFTFWDYRLPNSFRRNLGWRLDHIFVTTPLARAALGCGVDSEWRNAARPSDHTPVWAEFELA
jgi:exodeoxyribonuclease-3